VAVTNVFDKFDWANMFDKSGYALTGVPSRPREFLVTLRRKF
jgi:outer membrane receptor protein involved in Fe transport